MINVIWRFTCDFKKFSHERIKIINNFISSKIRNERFDEEEINKLTELKVSGGLGWRRAAHMGASWCVCQTATHNASVVCLSVFGIK